MPKKSKHKRKLQQEDFKKPKLKVGKKKPTAANFTNTTFKSRSIILPGQSITEDKTNEITNSRNLTLNELITQLKHYSPGTRRDAIQGLKDFFLKYPHALSESLTTIDKNVRRTLLAFLTEFMPSMPKSDLKPFLPLLIVYTCSAMTHIYEDIRIDAIKFIEIWLLVAPDVIVDGFWQKSANDKQLIGTTLKQLLKYLVVHFPYGSESEGTRDIKIREQVESILQEMDVLFCEMVILYLISTTSSPLSVKTERSMRARARKKRKKDDDVEMTGPNNFWVDQVFDYVIDFLGSESQNFSDRQNSSLAASLQNWVLSLPKLLWELKTSSLETTKVI
ncbi:10247_t:CDS:2 [Acaulospora colombiana]|uniref:10247_t:CDS:1 n=1 Tax=Acaulospora colombiana TaxID=27376 RepID=A0ACA9LY11_9GLOM|nr:10247_t:CDS:2 [Acaulospora colombiana]